MQPSRKWSMLFRELVLEWSMVFHRLGLLIQLVSCSFVEAEEYDGWKICLVVRTSTLRRWGVDHTVLPANTPHLPLPRSSPEDVTTEWTVIAPADEAYYSLVDPVRMKGWVGLVGWPAGPVQTSESLPVRDWHSTTEPPNQLSEPHIVVII